MGWLDDTVESITDGFVAVGDIFSDPLGALEDMFNASADFFSAGAWSYAKDAVRDYVQSLVPEQEYTDRTRAVKQATAARQGIYGRVRTGGQLVYAASNGEDKRVYWACYVLAGHECEEIEEVWADGELVATSNGPGVNGEMDVDTNTSLGDKQIYWAIHGNRSSAFIPEGFGNLTPPNWTEDHRLAFQSYVWVSFEYDKDVFQDSGLPRLEFTVRGRNNIYDPRDGSTGYTDNHALILLDIIRWDRTFGIPDSDIDMQAFEDAADISDEQVPNGEGTTEPRYTANGTFKFQITPLELLNSVAEAGAAFPVYSQGVWSIVPGAYSSPVMDLDESDLIGGLSFQSGPGKRNRHNKATGTYVDESQGFESVGFSQLAIQDYIDEDQEVLEKSFSFAWTNSGTMARRLAKINIERNRFGVSVNAAFKFRTIQLSPGDRVTMTIDGLGWDERVFRVESMEVSFDSGVQLQMREDDPAIYDWTEGDVLAIDDPPPLDLPDSVGASAPEDVEFDEELYQTLTRSAIKVRLIVSWENVTTARAYDIQFRRADASKWIDAGTFWQDDEIEINDVDDVLYDVRIRSIDGLGFRSDWNTFQYDVAGKSAPPPDVPTLFIRNRVLNWSYPDAPLDLAGFIVRFHNGDRRSWSDATPVSDNIITETYLNVDEFSGVKTFLVRAIDTTGNVSESSAILTEGLGDALLDNVIATKNEYPEWDGQVTRTDEFVVDDGSGAETLEIDDGLSVTALELSRPRGFINSDGYLEAQEVGTFYGEPDEPFYSSSENIQEFELDDGTGTDTLEIDDGVSVRSLEVALTTDFYVVSFERIEYMWTLDVPAQDEGSKLTVEVELDPIYNFKVEYIPPDYTGDYLSFPGSVEVREGVTQLKVSVPAQDSISGVAAPEVTDIITRLDVPDIEETLDDIEISASGTRLPITKTYRVIKNVSLTLQDDGGDADTAKVLDKDADDGPLVETLDDATPVSGTIDARIQGY